MGETGTSLTVRQSNLVPADLEQIQRWAKMFEASGLFTDARGFAAVAVKIAAGAEMDIPPFAAMRGIHIIKGTPALGVHIIAAKIKSSGRYNYRIREHTDTACEIAFFENGEEIGLSRFTMEDAKRAGLVRPDSGWTKYPRPMLYARALTQGARWYCPDVFHGAVYTAEELRAAPLEAESEDVTPPPPAPKPKVADVMEDAVDRLIADFDAAVASGAKPIWWEEVIPFAPTHMKDFKWSMFADNGDDGRMVAAWGHKMLAGAKKALKTAGKDTENLRELDANHLAIQVALILRQWHKRHGDPETGEVIDG